MPDTSPRLDLPYLMPSQAQKHVTHNEALQRLDALVQLSLTARDAETPPGSVDEGSVFALGAAPVGAWAGQAGQLALWDATSWQFITPKEGWRAWDPIDGQLYAYTGVTWEPVIGDLQGLEGLGIGTNWDATNRLAVASDASLFSHNGSGHQVKINKSADIDTATVLFQSGWAGHAEMGLAGDTTFSIKVSPDGSSWYKAFDINPTAQSISLAPAGIERMALDDISLTVDVPVTGTGVQGSSSDITSGRLVTVDGAKSAGLSTYGDYFDAVSGQDANTAIAGEAALYDTTTPGPWPLPAGNFLWVETQRMYIANSARQVATQYSGASLADPRQWVRVRARDTFDWTPWSEIYNQSSLVGVASSSSGVPTGAVFERGNNANGHYVRYADGTQICWASFALSSVAVTTAYAGGFYALGSNLTFPASFLVAPEVVLSCSDVTSSDALPLGADGANATSFTPSIWRATTATVDFSGQYIATGRWV